MKISVITAAFNSAATIRDTIASFDRQTHPSKEHWVIDGNSSDETKDLIVPSHERFLFSEKDTGVYDAMNKGIARATGDVVGFLNADDYYESPDVLKWVSSAFENSEADLVYGNLRYVDFDDTDKVVRDWRSEDFTSGMFDRGWMPPHPTVYARRELFEKFGGFDLGFQICADWEWLYRMFAIHKVRVKHIDEYFVRMRLGGISNRSIGNVWKSNREAAGAFLKHGTRMPWKFYPGKVMHRLKQFR